MSTPKILDQVKKLLQLAGPKNTAVEEARSAAHKAVALILEHGLVLSLPQAAPAFARPSHIYEPPRAPSYPPWSQPPPRPSWMDEDPPPPPDNPYRPPEDDDPPPPPRPPGTFTSTAEFMGHVNAILEWEARQAERKRRAKAARQTPRDGPYANGDSWMPDTHTPIDELFGAQHAELRKRRTAAWRRAGKPMKERLNAETGELETVPNYDGLGF
jgi:hypothetical protein